MQNVNNNYANTWQGLYKFANDNADRQIGLGEVQGGENVGNVQGVPMINGHVVQVLENEPNVNNIRNELVTHLQLNSDPGNVSFIQDYIDKARTDLLGGQNNPVQNNQTLTGKQLAHAILLSHSKPAQVEQAINVAMNGVAIPKSCVTLLQKVIVEFPGNKDVQDFLLSEGQDRHAFGRLCKMASAFSDDLSGVFLRGLGGTNTASDINETTQRSLYSSAPVHGNGDDEILQGDSIDISNDPELSGLVFRHRAATDILTGAMTSALNSAQIRLQGHQPSPEQKMRALGIMKHALMGVDKKQNDLGPNFFDNEAMKENANAELDVGIQRTLTQLFANALNGVADQIDAALQGNEVPTENYTEFHGGFAQVQQAPAQPTKFNEAKPTMAEWQEQPHAEVSTWQGVKDKISSFFSTVGGGIKTATFAAGRGIKTAALATGSAIKTAVFAAGRGIKAGVLAIYHKIVGGRQPVEEQNGEIEIEDINLDGDENNNEIERNEEEQLEIEENNDNDNNDDNLINTKVNSNNAKVNNPQGGKNAKIGNNTKSDKAHDKKEENIQKKDGEDIPMTDKEIDNFLAQFNAEQQKKDETLEEMLASLNESKNLGKNESQGEIK